MGEDDDLLFREWEDDSLLILEDLDNVPSSFQSSVNAQNINRSSSKSETFLKQIDEDLDYAFALSLQTQYEEEVKENINSDSKKFYVKESQVSKPLSIVDKQWELIDPHPDIHALFLDYDNKFFYGKLKHVEVKWSPRMTLCAGVCSYEGRGGLCSIRLSLPLLKLRPRKDLVETLLHEMIHAYLFVTHNNKDRDGHGPQFLSHMTRINKESGTRITVYHSFHDEVELYRQHVWKCNGPCKNKHPYYGVLKRAMNKPPGPKDYWWSDHQKNCGGVFVKIKEPDNYGKKKPRKEKATSESEGSSSDIRGFLKGGISNKGKSGSTASTPKTNVSNLNSTKVNGNNIATLSSTSTSSKSESLSSNDSYLDSSLANVNSIATLNSKNTSPKKLFVPFQGTGHKLGGSDFLNVVSSHLKGNDHNKAIASSSSSKRAIDVTALSGLSKVPRLSNVQEKLHKDHKPRTSTTSTLVQSPIEKFLSSKSVTSESSSIKKENYVNKSGVQESVVKRVSCPVCFVFIEEQEINSHLDTCLTC